MTYEVRLSGRAAKDLDHLDRVTQQRMLKRLEQIGEAPEGRGSRWEVRDNGNGLVFVAHK